DRKVRRKLLRVFLRSNRKVEAVVLGIVVLQTGTKVFRQGQLDTSEERMTFDASILVVLFIYMLRPAMIDSEIWEVELSLGVRITNIHKRATGRSNADTPANIPRWL